MARHHIRDNAGNLHIFNDSEYKKYKFNKGCWSVLVLLTILIGGILKTCNNDKKASSNSQEVVDNSEIQNQKEEGKNSINTTKLMNKQSQIEESEAIETQTSINATEDKSIVQEEILEASSSNEVINDDDYSEVYNELPPPEDQRLLKKQQKEERKRQKQMEKEAKRKAREAEKETKRKAREDDEQFEID